MIIIGEMTPVTGVATGLVGTEPVIVDSVSVRIGGGPPVSAELSLGAARVFKANVLVPGPPGPVSVTVTANYGGSHPPQTNVITAIATEGALSGCWLSDDGMLYFLNQSGNTLWGVGLDQGPGLAGRGLSVTTVFAGALNPGTTANVRATERSAPSIGIPPVTLGIQGAWADVPRGTRSLSGTLILDPQGGPGGISVIDVAAQTGGFSATKLTRVAYSPPQPADIQYLFGISAVRLNRWSVLKKLVFTMDCGRFGAPSI